MTQFVVSPVVSANEAIDFPARTPAVLTAVGILRAVVVPSPNCPKVLDPQQYAFWSEAIAQLRLEASSMDLMVFPASTPALETATGTFEATFDAFPSCPLPLFPQQYT